MRDYCDCIEPMIQCDNRGCRCTICDLTEAHVEKHVIRDTMTINQKIRASSVPVLRIAQHFNVDLSNAYNLVEYVKRELTNTFANDEEKERLERTYYQKTKQEMTDRDKDCIGWDEFFTAIYYIARKYSERQSVKAEV